MALAQMLEEMYDAAEIRDTFASFNAKELRAFDSELAQEVDLLIGKTEGRRPAHLKKLAKDHLDFPTLPAFVLLFAIIAQVRVAKIIELRDMFQGELAPGLGNRATCVGLHAFGTEMAKLYTSRIKFPYEVFEAYCSDAFAVDDGEEQRE